ncbi:Glucoamylase (glucan-1,4-alpha-glucosidase), GH15 family [Sanguibacter gelidistatuariae]|uniref:Glucoamylase (Glucan-1,4-alpha-glucosidase), GH15 family n=1 Tax=Sanguibacter gelidistatuariae TaxID=1814289 RepID=A0A1G6T8F3_9MICO|nr:glycoside hydrolase family 15 protein [Sanguibacter gelidistatuariae]SDD25273.1 Glucoamylase (glucan-1,4-alpha-glucosidase), GH15 family [Sanguibacter gelidistatuariae]
MNAEHAPTPTPIADYAVLGDGRSCALVSRTGSIDWLCLPAIDSPACFAALLGTPDHGRWLLTVPDAHRTERRYVGDSFVLETTYTSPTGRARVTDVMISSHGRADVVRMIEVLTGTVTVEHEWVVRFGYGAYVPWVHRVEDRGTHAIRAFAGPDSLLLRGPRLPRGAHHRHRDVFTGVTGDRLTFTSTWVASWDPTPDVIDTDERRTRSARDWHEWAARCRYDGPHRDPLIRSLLVLRLLTSSETGGIVAAATTSLPERIGGKRNWDYRFCWLRDAAMALEALIESGYDDESSGWRDWLLRAVAGDPADVQIMYGIDGRRDLPERTLDHLPGYAGSGPVRIGNAAVGQVQNDVLGEVMWALDMARDAGLAESAESWSLQRHLINDLVRRWDRPDRGIWEVRGPMRDFVHSRVMSWAAIDRAIHAFEAHGLPGPVDVWRAARSQIHDQVMERGWDADLNSFVQYYGASHTDAALLQMVQVGFLGADDPRFLGTVEAIRTTLTDPYGFTRRYATDATRDGVGGEESPFVVCSFWLVDALARCGDTVRAHAMFDHVVTSANDLGLMAEEYDGAARQMTGNFPQAFSHLGLVRAVHSLDRADAAAGATDAGSEAGASVAASRSADGAARLSRGGETI